MPVCNRCRARYPRGGKCPNGCFGRAKKERNRLYDREERDNKYSRFYQSAEWKRVRDKARYDCNGLDVFAYVLNKEWKHGRIVHHIVEIKEDWSKRLDEDNLILLADDTHEQIHQMYRDNRERTQELLRDCLRKFKMERDK